MGESLNQLQYAYRAIRGVADASRTLLDTVALATLSPRTQMSGFYSWIFHLPSIYSKHKHTSARPPQTQSQHIAGFLD